MNKEFFDKIAKIVSDAQREHDQKEQEVNFGESEVEPIEACPHCGQSEDKKDESAAPRE